MSLKKEFAVKALKKIKEICETHQKLRALGVDLMELDSGVNLLEESIVLLFVTDKTKVKIALDDVGWWLYENVDKIFTLADKSQVDVNTPEAFVDWLEKWYSI